MAAPAQAAQSPLERTSPARSPLPACQALTCFQVTMCSLHPGGDARPVSWCNHDHLLVCGRLGRMGYACKRPWEQAIAHIWSA